MQKNRERCILPGNRKDKNKTHVGEKTDDVLKNNIDKETG